jgi:hypothetical protein
MAEISDNLASANAFGRLSLSSTRRFLAGASVNLSARWRARPKERRHET